MITIQREDLTPELYGEIIRLLIEHNDETASTFGSVEPYIDAYVMLNAQNGLDIIIARDDKEMIGYMIMFVSNHLHHQSIKYGTQDMFFVTKKYRVGSTGSKLLKEAEKVMVARGVQYIVMSCSESMNLEKYYAKKGYVPMERTFYKKLEV